MKIQAEVKIDKYQFENWFRTEDELTHFIRREVMMKMSDEITKYVEFTEEKQYHYTEYHYITHVLTNENFKAIINSLKELDVNATQKSKDLINNIYNNLTK